MSIIYEQRLSDSPYVEIITYGQTESDGSSIRPAESHWHIVFVRNEGNVQSLVVGPWTTSGFVSWGEGAEILWIKLKLGTFMPHLPTKSFLNTETILPTVIKKSFWLDGSTWQLPNYENADTFIDRLVRNNILIRDPLVNAVLQQGQNQETPSRTIRHRFRHVTGLTQSHIQQMKRAQYAETLLQQGYSILDTVHEAGYFDQPHMTRSLKQFIGYTPAQIIQLSQIQ